MKVFSHASRFAADAAQRILAALGLNASGDAHGTTCDHQDGADHRPFCLACQAWHGMRI